MRRFGAGAIALLVSACSLLVDSGDLSSESDGGGGGGGADGSISSDGSGGGTDGASDAARSDVAIDSSLPNYAKEVLADKPILYYRLEEGSTVKVSDETGTNDGLADAK